MNLIPRSARDDISSVAIFRVRPEPSYSLWINVFEHVYSAKIALARTFAGRRRYSIRSEEIENTRLIFIRSRSYSCPNDQFFGAPSAIQPRIASISDWGSAGLLSGMAGVALPVIRR